MSKKTGFSSRIMAVENKVSLNGFRITFNNGVTVSVQYSYATHCGDFPKIMRADESDIDFKTLIELEKGNFYESVNYPNAEIAIYDNKYSDLIQEYINSSGLQSERGDQNTDMGWIDPDKLVDMLIWAKNYKPQNDSKESMND